MPKRIEAKRAQIAKFKVLIGKKRLTLKETAEKLGVKPYKLTNKLYGMNNFYADEYEEWTKILTDK